MKSYGDRGGCYPWRLQAEADNTLRYLHNSSYDTKAEFNNCFIVHSKIIPSLKTKLKHGVTKARVRVTPRVRVRVGVRRGWGGVRVSLIACVAQRFCRAGRTSGEAAGSEIHARSREKNKNCSRPNLRAVFMPSPIFITQPAQPKPPRYAGYGFKDRVKAYGNITAAMIIHISFIPYSYWFC